MKKILILILPILFTSCEKKSNKTDFLYKAKIVDYDRNCSSCIIYFPDDSLKIIAEIGISESNYFHAVNLNMEDFIIGQNIKVQLREATVNEITPCIELYIVNDYKDVYITELETLNNLIFNDTILINNYDYLVNTDNMISLRMDSVVNDSRCPSGGVCFWEGDAIVSFSFTVDNETKSFDLHTNSKFQMDTLINGYKIKMIDLSPYPSTNTQIIKEDYKAKLLLID